MFVTSIFEFFLDELPTQLVKNGCSGDKNCKYNDAEMKKMEANIKKDASQSGPT